MKKNILCIDCRKRLSRPDAKRCKKCYILWLKNNSKFFNHADRFGSNNPNFNKDNTHNNKYQNCGIHISKNSTRCQSCAGKERFKNKKLHLCIDCGNEVKNFYSKRCAFCAHDWNINPNWKGGISSLSKLIRNLPEYTKWIVNIFERDNYTCQQCGQRGGNLEAHHNIKLFNEILKEFLQDYNQFSPIEDKETLVRLAINYNKFWNLDNGITLCNECHKNTFSKIRGL